MKKIKMLLVGLLTVLMSLYCLTGCYLLQVGTYKAVSYKAGPVSIEVGEDNESYVELKYNKEAYVSIDLVVTKMEGTGTWEAGEEKNEVIITIDEVKYPVTIEGNTMTVEILGTEVILER